MKASGVHEGSNRMEDRNRKTSGVARGSGLTESERKKSKMEQEAMEEDEAKRRKRDEADQGDWERLRPEAQEEAGEKRKREEDDEGFQGTCHNCGKVGHKSGSAWRQSGPTPLREMTTMSRR